MTEVSGADIIARKLFDMYCPPIIYFNDFAGYMTVGENGVNTVSMSVDTYLSIVYYPTFYLETMPERFTLCSILRSTIIDNKIVVSFMVQFGAHE